MSTINTINTNRGIFPSVINADPSSVANLPHTSQQAPPASNEKTSTLLNRIFSHGPSSKIANSANDARQDLETVLGAYISDDQHTLKEFQDDYNKTGNPDDLSKIDITKAKIAWEQQLQSDVQNGADKSKLLQEVNNNKATVEREIQQLRQTGNHQDMVRADQLEFTISADNSFIAVINRF